MSEFEKLCEIVAQLRAPGEISEFGTHRSLWRI